MEDYVDNDEFEYEISGSLSDSILQNWTLQAIDCYKIKSDCRICPIKKAGYSFECKMKYVVKILLKTLGLPDETLIQNQTGINKDIVA